MSNFIDIDGSGNPLTPANLSQRRTGGWSQATDMLTGQETPGVGPQALFKTLEGKPFAREFTCRFAIDRPQPNPLDEAYENIVDALAVIHMKVNGVAIQRSISLVQGAVISGEAEAVDVQIYDITPALGQQLQQNYRVITHVAVGPRPSYALPPTLEAFTDTVNGAARVDSGVILVNGGGIVITRWPIPQGVGVISVEVLVVDEVDPATPPDVLVTIGNGLKDYKAYNPYNEKGFICIPPNATELVVTNFGSEGTQVAVTATWGIEG